MNIRMAREKDLNQLISLLKVLTEREESFDFDEEAHRKGLNLLIKDQPRCCVAVAEDDKIPGKIVGMSTGQCVFSTAMGTPSVWIEDVVVLPDYRRQNLGSHLLQFIEDWGYRQGALRGQLLIDRDNSSAAKFYGTQKWQNTNFSCLRKNFS